MDNLDFARDGLLDFSSFDGRDTRYPFTTSLMPRQSWPLPMEQSLSQDNGNNQRRSTTPLQTTTGGGAGLHSTAQHQAFTTANNSPTFFSDWTIPQQSQALPFGQDPTAIGSHFAGALDASFQVSPIDYSMATTQAAMNATIPLDAPFGSLPEADLGLQWPYWQDLEHAIHFPSNDGLPDFTAAQTAGRRSLIEQNSPSQEILETISLPSSGSDNGYALINQFPNMETYQQAQTAIFNPAHTLHLRSNSDSSHSDIADHNSFGSSWEDTGYPPFSPYSPGSETNFDQLYPCEIVSPSATVDAVPIKASASQASTSPASQAVNSPPSRRPSRKSPTARSPTSANTKPLISRRPSAPTKKDTEKRVGRRHGPLRPDQRKQASEIRKIRACLRCKFLKKTVRIF
jgi:hypothetical protein